MRLGIDPGLTGALVLISGREIVGCWDMPTYSYTVKAGGKVRTRRSIDSYLLYKLLGSIKTDTIKTGLKIVVERQQHNMGKQAVDTAMTAFTVGHQYGKVLACLEILFPDDFAIVHPTSWKTRAQLKKTSKADAIAHVQAHFSTGEHIRLQKHSGRADATLIAYYGL